MRQYEWRLHVDWMVRAHWCQIMHLIVCVWNSCWKWVLEREVKINQESNGRPRLLNVDKSWQRQRLTTTKVDNDKGWQRQRLTTTKVDNDKVDNDKVDNGDFNNGDFNNGQFNNWSQGSVRGKARRHWASPGRRHSQTVIILICFRSELRRPAKYSSTPANKPNNQILTWFAHCSFCNF